MGNVISSLKVTGSRLLREDVQLDPREMYRIFQHMMQQVYDLKAHPNDLIIRKAFVKDGKAYTYHVEGAVQEDWLTDVCEVGGGGHTWTEYNFIRKATDDDVTALNVLARVGGAL